MNATPMKHSPVERQLEAYEETWKKEQDAVKKCWASEDAAAVGVAMAMLIENVAHSWRDRVFRGIEEYTDAANNAYRGLFESWSRITTAALKRLDSLAQIYGVVEGASKLQQAETRIREQLTNWQPPRLSSAVGLREMTLNPTAAAELDRVLSLPGPLPSGSSRPRMMVEMPLDELRRRSKTS